jgi:phage terminase small subunit
MPELNARQKAFVNEYVKTKNATVAALAAGYSQTSVRYQGTKLLSTPAVREKIDEMLRNVAVRAETDLADVIKGLKSLAEDEEQSGQSRVRAWTEIAKILTKKEREDNECPVRAYLHFGNVPRPPGVPQSDFDINDIKEEA